MGKNSVKYLKYGLSTKSNIYNKLKMYYIIISITWATVKNICLLTNIQAAEQPL